MLHPLSARLTACLFLITALNSLHAAGVDPAGIRSGNLQPDPVSAIRQRAFDLNRAAVHFEKQRDYPGAVDALEQAVALWEPGSEVLPAVHSGVLANLADACEFTGNWSGAATALKAAVELNKRAWGAADPRTLRMQVRLGEAEVVLGEFSSADTRLHNALELQRNIPGESKRELALTLGSVTVLDVNIGRLAEAEQLAGEAVVLAGEMDADSADYGAVVGVLAGVYVVERANARALPLLTKSIDILERHAPDNVRLAPLLVQRGLVETDDQKYTLAERDMQRAIAILDGPNGPNINADWARLHLARLYLIQHRVDDADAIIPATVARQRRFLGAPGRRLALCVRELARLRAMQKRYEEAAGLYREILGMAGSAPAELAAVPALRKRVTEKDVRTLEQRACIVFDTVRSD